MSRGSYDYLGSRMEAGAYNLRHRHPDKPHVLALADILLRISTVMDRIEHCDSNDDAWDGEVDALIRKVVTPEQELTSALVKAKAAYGRLGVAIRRMERDRRVV